MNTDFNFFKPSMPETRKADFHLGCLDGSVFIDFNLSDENLISLRRISFDGYGCCDLAESSNHLNLELSDQFREEISKEEVNQVKLAAIVKEIVKINKEYIWSDALKEYNLLD